MNYKPLDTDFMLKGFRHTQLKRQGDVAIFHKVAIKNNINVTTKDAGFEVVIISRHDGYELGGVKIEPAETYPSNSQWGIKGWTYTDLYSAECRFNKLVNGEVPEETPEETEEVNSGETSGESDGENTPEKKHRGRQKGPRPELIVPGAEFSVGDLAEQNKVQYPIAFVFVKENLEKGMLKLVRSERRASRGKPTNIYAAVSK